MNTSLFSFFVVYVLIVLPGLLGYVWEDDRFYVLAAINLLCFVLYSLIVRLLEKKPVAEKVAPVVPEVKEKTADHAHVHQFVKYPYGTTKKSFKKRRKLFVGILVALFLFVTVMAFRPYLTSFVTDLLAGEGNTSKTLFTGEGLVLSSGLADDIDVVNTGSENSGFEETGFVITGSVVSTGVITSGATDIFSSTEEVVSTGKDTQEVQVTPSEAIKSKLGITDAKSLTMMDGIVYLLDVYSVVLSSKKDVRFAYVTTANPYYAYWKTAYDKRLIGKDNSPSKLMFCETYITLKGMIAGWDVKYSAATVKTAFWAEAKKRGELKGCVVGKVVKGENL